MLTNEELQALDAILDEAIVRSQAEDNGDPVFQEVDVLRVNPFADSRKQSDVFESLAKKGLIECSGLLDSDGSEAAEQVCITPAGLDALKQTKGVN